MLPSFEWQWVTKFTFLQNATLGCLRPAFHPRSHPGAGGAGAADIRGRSGTNCRPLHGRHSGIRNGDGGLPGPRSSRWFPAALQTRGSAYGLDADGNIWSWGLNRYGQLERFPKFFRREDEPQTVRAVRQGKGDKAWEFLGTARGINSTTNSHIPVPVAPAPATTLPKFIAIAAARTGWTWMATSRAVLV